MSMCVLCLLGSTRACVRWDLPVCVCLCQNSLRGVQAINSADQPVFVTRMQEFLHMLCTHGSALNPIPYPFETHKCVRLCFPNIFMLQ